LGIADTSRHDETVGLPGACIALRLWIAVTRQPFFGVTPALLINFNKPQCPPRVPYLCPRLRAR
jgi:hypothetical protein